MMSASSVLFFLFSFVYTALALVPDPEFERQVGLYLDFMIIIMMLFPIICCCFACTAYIVFRHGRSSAELSSLQEEIEYVKDAKTELKPTVDDLEELVSTKKNEVDKLVKNLKSMREVNAETANQIDNEWKATMNRENLHKQLQALRHDRKCLKTAQKGLTTPINEQVTEVKEKFNRYSD